MTGNKDRKLGRSNISVSPMGLGCWAIGGNIHFQGLPLGWGTVNDEESKKALKHGIEMGVNFIDTADVYGAGHSEKLIGEVIKNQRDKVVIASKFGMKFNDKTHEANFSKTISKEYLNKALENSLRRLQTDYLDLYQLHINNLAYNQAAIVREQLETFVSQGKIRTYGWSTDDAKRAAFFAEGDHCSAVQQELNLFVGNEDILKLCEEKDLASINRGPLAMGVLTGKYTMDSVLPDDDCRTILHLMGDDYYMFFENGKPLPHLLYKLESIKEILTSNGRTPAQGALAWIWAKSSKTIPIPGFKTVKQVDENARAMEFGPLTGEQMVEIENILSPQTEIIQ